MQARLWSISGLAVELGVDRRTVARRLQGLEPDEVKGRTRRWRMARVVAHLVASAADEEHLDVSRERARLDRLRADKLDLELSRERGDLVRVPEVAALWQTLAGEARTRLLAVPTKVAPLVIGFRRIAQVKDALDRELHDALGAIAEVGPGVPGRAAPAAAADGERVGRRASKAQPRKRRRARKVAD